MRGRNRGQTTIALLNSWLIPATERLNNPRIGASKFKLCNTTFPNPYW